MTIPGKLGELNRTWDVVVVGAGPAGSAAAISCARNGLKVLLVEAKKFPRRKPCGGCLNQVSISLLQQLLGSDHALWTTARELSRFMLLHRGERFAFPTPTGCAIERSLMDQSLVDKAQDLGVQFLSSTTAVLASAGQVQGQGQPQAQGQPVAKRSILQAQGQQVNLTRGGEHTSVAAQVVVLACGLGNRLAATNMPELQQNASKNSRVGVEAIYLKSSSQYAADTIHMVVSQDGYVGLTQIADGRLHVAAAVNRRSLQQYGPQSLVDVILRDAGAPPLMAEEVVWRGTPPLTSRAARMAGERVFLVGDAMGYIEPFTGEGIRWALETGIGVAGFAREACQAWDHQLIARWEAWYRRHITGEQRLCRQITSGLKHPALCWLAHHVLRLRPQIASKIIHRLNTRSSKTSIRELA